MLIPATILIEKVGIKMALIVSILNSVVGASIALLINNIAAEFIGQLIVDAGFPIIIACCTKIPAVWFPYKERFYATSFVVLAGLVGYAMGDASLAVFNNKPTGFALTLIFVGIGCIALIFLLFKEKPSVPPSVS